MNYDENELRVNKVNHHFEMDVEGETAFIDYRQKGDTVYLVHTEVPVHLRGRGIGTAIIVKALDYIKSNNLKFVPLCTTIKAFLAKK